MQGGLRRRCRRGPPRNANGPQESRAAARQVKKPCRLDQRSVRPREHKGSRPGRRTKLQRPNKPLDDDSCRGFKAPWRRCLLDASHCWSFALVRVSAAQTPESRVKALHSGAHARRKQHYCTIIFAASIASLRSVRPRQRRRLCTAARHRAGSAGSYGGRPMREPPAAHPCSSSRRSRTMCASSQKTWAAPPRRRCRPAWRARLSTRCAWARVVCYSVTVPSSPLRSWKNRGSAPVKRPGIPWTVS